MRDSRFYFMFIYEMYIQHISLSDIITHQGKNDIKIEFCLVVLFFVCVLSHSDMSNTFAIPWTVDPKATRLLYPCNFPGKNTGVGCHFLLQGIFPTQDVPD